MAVLLSACVELKRLFKLKFFSIKNDPEFSEVFAADELFTFSHIWEFVSIDISQQLLEFKGERERGCTKRDSKG